MDEKITEFAKSLPITAKTVRNRLGLLDLDEDVPCYVHEMSLPEAKLLALRENLERSDLTPMEEARAFYENLISEKIHKSELTKSTATIAKANKTGVEPKRGGTVIPKFGFDVQEISKLAKSIGVSQSHVRVRLYLLYLPEEIQTMLDNETLFIREAKILS